MTLNCIHGIRVLFPKIDNSAQGLHVILSFFLQLNTVSYVTEDSLGNFVIILWRYCVSLTQHLLGF